MEYNFFITFLYILYPSTREKFSIIALISIWRSTCYFFLKHVAVPFVNSYLFGNRICKISYVICIQCIIKIFVWTRNVCVQDKYLKKIINFYLDSIILRRYDEFIRASVVVRFTINLNFNKVDFYDIENMVDNCKY